MKPFPPIANFADKSFDPFIADDSVFGDVEDIFTPLAELRRRAPVVEASFPASVGMPGLASMAAAGQREFLVLGHDEVLEVATNPETFQNGPALETTLKATFGNTLSVMDPPEHGQYRRLFQKAFLPNVIRHWGTTVIAPVVDRLIDEFAGAGEAELVAQFTRRFPFEVIFGQLDLPHEHRAVFHAFAVAQTLVVSAEYAPQAQEASAKLGAFLKALVDMRREEPGDDIVSILAAAEVEGEQLPDEIIVSFLRQLLNAGGDTTFRCTSSLLYGLLNNPDQLEAVRADRSLVANGVEEALRWETPSGIVPRYVARDVVLGGGEIPAGSHVELFFSMANREPSIFSDPDRFDVFRRRLRNFGFGTGPHICIGQHLARLEMAHAVNALLDRLPGLRLDPREPAPKIQGIRLRYPRQLPVVFN